jgi:hypothetical protein
VARLVDWLIVLILSAPLWAFTVVHLKDKAVEDAASLAGTSAWHLMFGRRWSIGGEVAAELSKFWAYATLFVGITVLGQVLLAAVYEVLLSMMWGRTFGKAAFSLAVVRSDGAPLGAKQFVLRAALTIVLPGTGWALILAGAVWLSVWLMLLGLVLVVLSAVECLLLRGSTCWHDRRTRTSVVLSSTQRQVYGVGQSGFPQTHGVDQWGFPQAYGVDQPRLPQTYDAGQSGFPQTYDVGQSGFPQTYDTDQWGFPQDGSLTPQPYQTPQRQQAISGAQQRYQQVRDSELATRAIAHGKRLGEKLKRRWPGHR